MFRGLYKLTWPCRLRGFNVQHGFEGSEVFNKRINMIFAIQRFLKTIKSKVGVVIQITIYSHMIYYASNKKRERKKKRTIDSFHAASALHHAAVSSPPAPT